MASDTLSSSLFMSFIWKPYQLVCRKKMQQINKFKHALCLLQILSVIQSWFVKGFHEYNCHLSTIPVS
jgi:hypothetical protein